MPNLSGLARAHPPDPGAACAGASRTTPPDPSGAGADPQSGLAASLPATSLDRDIGRLEGRVDSLERAVERLENSVNGLLRIIDFARNGIRLVYAAIGLIGIDGLVRAVAVLAHLAGR
ncbi:MAG: hypothetical protein ABF791_07635 [Acetobacter sp.]|uniref:hypothetical protein n=1 Tax=Acetobacter sp. TaxID=440 RepID=UPI0039ECEC57